MSDNFQHWKRRRLVPPEPRIFLSLRFAHIKSTDDWAKAREWGVWVVATEEWLKSPAHTYPFPRNDPLFSATQRFSASSHMAKLGGEERQRRICEKPFSRVAEEKEVWGGPRDMVKEPLGWFSFLRHRHGVGLFKKNVAVAVVVCFFIDRTWRIFSGETEPFCAIICVCSLECHQIFSFTQFLRRRMDASWGEGAGKWVIFYGTSAEYNGDLVIIIREMLMLSSFYIRHAISAYSLGEPCMFRRSMSGL